MVEVSDYDYRIRGDLTVKRYLADVDLLVQAELQISNPRVDAMDGLSTYGHNELMSELMATYFAAKGIMLDVGWGHYDENLRIRQLDRDAIDVNVHWFLTSHIEA